MNLSEQPFQRGSLIEINAETHGVCHAIIGVGVNVNMLADESAHITQAWTSMQQILKKYIDSALDNLRFIASVMIGGGIILLFIDTLFKENAIAEEKNISYPKAFVIGCFQVLSVLFPGLSRSAATIIGGMSQKLTRSLAAEFSFFLAVPTMFAASAKSFYDVYKEHPEVLVKNNMTTLGIGAVVSFIVALFSIRFFINYLQKHGFKLFGFYRIMLGIIILVLLFAGAIHNN